MASPAAAQGDAGDGGAGDGAADNATAGVPPPYNFVVYVRQDPANPADGPFSFTPASAEVPSGARVALVYDSTGATGLHNARPRPPEGQADHVDPPIDGNSGQTFSVFTMPASGEVSFACDVHPEMKGAIAVGEKFNGGKVAGGAAQGDAIVKEGVHFLAHWVGVIAFAVLFIIYGVTFFLFRNNESAFSTDHKDRAVPAGGGAAYYGEEVRTNRMTAWVLGFILLVGAIVFVVAVARGWIEFGV